MKRIQVRFTPETEKFLRQLKEKARKKIEFNIEKVEAQIRGEHFEKMKGTDGIWEVRTLYEGMYYRLFAFWDKTKPEQTLVICTHGIAKKKGKTPLQEIEKAEQMKRLYFTHINKNKGHP
jgi:phage-related protein